LKKSLGVLLYPLFLILMAAPLLIATPVGQSAVKSLPFTDSQDYQTVDYRINLAKAGYTAVKDNPLFGSGKYGYAENVAMQEMIQGQGIIDLVNSYLTIALKHGLIVLLLFACALLTLLYRFYRLSNALPSPENRHLSHILFSIVLSIVVMLGVTGSSAFIPYYYWAIISLGTAFITISEKNKTVICTPVTKVGRKT